MERSPPFFRTVYPNRNHVTTHHVNVLLQTACLVVNPITVGNFAFLFNCMPVGRASDSMTVTNLIVLQQTHHIVTHTGPHRVTSSNIYQNKAQSLGSSKLHDATVRTEGENFYGLSKEGTSNTLV